MGWKQPNTGWNAIDVEHIDGASFEKVMFT